MDVFTAIKERYSYRGMYKTDPVPREDLKRIMEAGFLAPSGCNRQTTRLVGLDDPERLKAVGGLLEKQWISSAPAAVCVLAVPTPGNGGIYYHVQDYSAAIENMLLAVTALGYASCWLEGCIINYEEISEKMAGALGAPKEAKMIAYLPVGKPAGEYKQPEKMPFEERAWFNRFGAGRKSGEDGE